MSFNRKWILGTAFAASLLAVGLFAVGCGDGGGGDDDSSSSDIGDNNPDMYVAIGDSITEGVGEPDQGAPYPARLSAILGKSVANEGVGGQTAGSGLARMASVLSSYKPGHILILFGANDAILGVDPESTASSLRAMVQMAKNNKTIPLLATTPQMTKTHEAFNSAVLRLNPLIRNVASSEGVTLVDLEAEFGTSADMTIFDGLHPSDLGNQTIAFAFSEKL